MPRRVRECGGGIVYHVLNRAVGRMKLLEKDRDLLAFENEEGLLGDREVPVWI